MAMGSVLFALAMVAADGPSCPPVETTTYHVRVLTLDGLDWRTSSYSRLQPVARQGTSMIWTADRALAASLIDRAKPQAPCHTIMAVGEAVLTKAEVVNYVATMERVADGPVNQSSAIAFMPRPEQLEERFSIKVEGRRLDQGVLTRIALEETHVDVIHGVPQTETLVPPAPKGSKSQAEYNRETLNIIRTATSNVPEVTSITSSVQIPEVTRASVAGEWLIPNDGVLLVSLGVKTAANDKGMAVVRERVAVIEACDARDLGPNGVCKTMAAGQHAGFQHIKLSQPIVPGRSLPEAIDPNGNLVDLPPLPEALASADLDRIKPEPNQPSPQAPIQPSPSADPALARTSYDAASPAPRAPMTFTVSEAQGRSILPKKALEFLAKAGVETLDIDFQVKSGGKPKSMPEIEGLVGEDIDIELEPSDLAIAVLKAGDDVEWGDVIIAMIKAGVKFDKAPFLGTRSFLPAKAECEKCDGDSSFCPANARSMKVGQVAGGIKLVPDSTSSDGVSNHDALWQQIREFAAFLDAAECQDEALKLVGQTRTTVVPLSHHVSLELKATVLHSSPEKATTASKKEETPAARR